MNTAAIPKIGIALAWLFSGVAVLMIVFVTDRYRGGYEDMINDAGYVFQAAIGVAAGATWAARILRRKNPGSISRAWMAWGTAHLVLSILLMVGVFAWIRWSS